ncbi:MAG: DUF2231 domain-containing protein [Gemmatimonadales bacterium]
MLGYDWPRLHAALNDLPAAVLLVAVIFDVLAAITKRPSLRIAGYWTMLAGAIGGVLAVLSGLQAEEHIAHGEAVHEIMETHEKLAFVTLGIFAVLALWRIFRETRMGSGERGLSLLLSIGGVVALFATSILGGKMVFEHAAGIPTPVLQEEMHERSEGHHHHGGEAEEAEAHQHDEGETSDSAAPGGGHTHPPGTPPHKD